jgi:putative hemolysin
MKGLALEALIVILLILVNGVLAMAEVAVVASRKARRKQRAMEGDLKAKAALDLAESPGRFLSTVQIGITLIGVLAGAFGGATIAEEIAAYLYAFPSLAPHAESIGLGLVVLVITYLSLVVGELVPKSIALYRPERIASLVALPMRWLSVLASPLVTALTLSTDAVLRVMGLKATEEPPVTEQEITVMIEQGTQAGVFDPAEHSMVKRVFRMGDRTVGSLMTLRPDIVWIDLDNPADDNLKKLSSSVYSRMPVCRGDLDNVEGILRAKDMLRQCLSCGVPDLRDILHEPVFVPETLPALKLLEKMKESRTTLSSWWMNTAPSRLVTLHDILEAIVGGCRPWTSPTSRTRSA